MASPVRISARLPRRLMRPNWTGRSQPKRRRWSGWPSIWLIANAARRHLAIPALRETEMDIELIQDPHHDVVDDFIDGLGVVVEGRHRRKDHDAHARQLEHVLQVNVIE